MKSLLFKSTSNSTFIGTALVASVALSMTACSHKKSESSAHKIDTVQIMSDRNLTTAQKSEELALAAEQLISASSVIYANDVADLALQLDKGNVRARFWKAALGPVVQTRGLANRVAPLMHNLGKDSDYQEFLRNMKTSVADSQNVQFLMDGPQDIATERDVQEYVAQTTLRMDEFRRTMKSLRNQTLAIHLNTDLKNAWNSQQDHTTCTATETDGVYTYNCDVSKTATIELNSADFEALEVAAAGSQIYSTIYNGWDLTGTIAYAKAHPEQEQRDPMDVAQELLANPNFGKMLKPAAFGVIPDLGKDILLGARYAQQKQDELCKGGDENQINRPGQLFEKGFCAKITPEVDNVMIALASSLSGSVTPFTFGEGSAQKTITMNLRNLFTKSLRDVRSYFPVQRNACGKVTSVNNSTFDGTLAAGELNQLLAQSSNADCQSNQ